MLLVVKRDDLYGLILFILATLTRALSTIPSRPFICFCCAVRHLENINLGVLYQNVSVVFYLLDTSGSRNFIIKLKAFICIFDVNTYR